VIEKLSWLHVSDLHVKAEGDTWPQEVVLREMVADIGRRAAGIDGLAFVVVSGDLAYSGRQAEYTRVRTLLDQLSDATGLPRTRVFCVPGNHDVDLSLSRFCHAGAVSLLDSPQAVEQLLGDAQELRTLLERQSAYRAFESDVSRGMARTMTPDTLGYVAGIDVQGLQIAVLALNSAWLCEGGEADEQRIVVGDRQMIEALATAESLSPRLVIAAMHHPPDWLRPFDRSAVYGRLLPRCSFIHRGHLHERGVTVASNLSGDRCIGVTAGAAFATRDFENSYSVVEVSVAESACRVQSFAYTTRRGTFRTDQVEEVAIQLRGTLPFSIADVADSIAGVMPGTAGISHYLAALVLGKAVEVPVRLGNNIAFVAPKALQDMGGPEATEKTRRFLGLQNILRAYGDAVPVVDRISEQRDRIQEYADWLYDTDGGKGDLRGELGKREAQFAGLARSEAPGVPQHSQALMRRLLAEGDWHLLEETARRHGEALDERVANEARRMLCLAMANADEPDKQAHAGEIALDLVRCEEGSFEDVQVGVVVLKNLGNLAAARQAILDGLSRFPGQVKVFEEVATQLVVETGDTQLRDALAAARERWRENQ